MRKQSHIITIILSFFLVLSALIAAGQHQAVAHAAGKDRIYYFNMSANGVEGEMILVETDGHWGLIDAGHRKATTIQDDNGAVYSTAGNGLSSQINCRNGKDVANYMINKLGVTHLDFIIGTHAHSDHIGGIPEIAATTYKDASGRTRYLVDSGTTYYYKEYQHISDVEDDLAHYSSNSWHNQAFVHQAKTAMENCGAELVDISKAQVIHGDPGNTYGDYITFEVGNMSFRLYNVHEQTNTGNENVNSIVTVMTNGNYTVVNLADINTNNGAIDKTSKAIAKDYGDVDVVVAGHHGYAGSNTKTMFDSLQPSFVVVPNGQESSWLYTDCDLAAAMPYAKSLFDTNFYNLSISQYAVVTDLSGQKVYIYSVNGKGDLSSAINKMMKSANKTSWVSWVQTNSTLWSYLENGKSVKNDWRRIDGKLYHFDKTGIMQTGWYNDGKGTRYLDSDGALVTGWQLINNKWYYFDSYYGYRYENSWQKIDDKVYFFNKDGTMHIGWHTDSGGTRYLDSSGALVTGSQQIDGKWYYFEPNYGYKQIKKGWQRENGVLRYYNSDETMRTGWYNDGTGTRYLDPNDGSLTLGWRQIDGNWYYFDSYYGYRCENSWQKIDDKVYFFNKDGTMHTGWHTDSGGTRYLDSSGALVTGSQQIDGKWYYFEPNYGYKQVKTGWQRENGVLRYYNSDETLRTGWYNDGTGIRYLDPSDGSLTLGWRQIDGIWYYFDNYYGYRQTGWQRIDGPVYYFNASGEMQTGWLNVEGKTRYLDSNGALVTGWQQLGDKWYYFSTDDGNMARDTQIDGYYVNADGVWVP